MRINYILYMAALVLISCQDGPATSVLLQNPIDRDRIDESFVLSRAELKYADNDLMPALKTPSGEYVASQVDDIDNDGVWDELAFVVDIKGSEKTKLTVEWLPADRYPAFEKRTNIRYGYMTSPGIVEEFDYYTRGKHNLPRSSGYPFQMDGPTWENDKVAFRHYIDGRNCRDLFGKRVTDMVLDTVGIRADGCPDNTYQVLRDWGCDILSVANSFGLGGIALAMPDTIVRMGVEYKDTVDIINSTHFEILTEGPVRSIFRLDFIGWNVPGACIDVHDTVTIWAGKNGHEENITASELPENSQLITGIVANNNTLEPVKKDYDGKWTGMITHDRQTVGKDHMLGMALLIPTAQLNRTFHAPDEGESILKTWCAALTPASNGYHFRVYAGWDLGVDNYADRNDFISLIDDYAFGLNHPITVIVK